MIICLDPGHGGYDPGAVNGSVREKDITLAIALQLRDLLRQAGVTVVMTRETDVSPGGFNVTSQELQERCRIANAARADFFLSVHVNAGGGTGAEIYVYEDGGPTRPLAQAIIDETIALMGRHGQPIRDGSDLAVIRGTSMPAMLLEIGFIDSGDLPKIQANLREFAPRIARAILNHYGIERREDAAMLKPEDANKVISLLSAIWHIVPTQEAKNEMNRLANELRQASGQPKQ